MAVRDSVCCDGECSPHTAPICGGRRVGPPGSTAARSRGVAGAAVLGAGDGPGGVGDCTCRVGTPKTRHMTRRTRPDIQPYMGEPANANAEAGAPCAPPPLPPPEAVEAVEWRSHGLGRSGRKGRFAHYAPIQSFAGKLFRDSGLGELELEFSFAVPSAVAAGRCGSDGCGGGCCFLLE